MTMYQTKNFSIKNASMANPAKISPLAQSYFEHYVSGQGGAGNYPAFRGRGYPVFRGAPYQTGQGLGDILRSIGRFLLPIATSAAGAFMESASSAINEGKNLREAAKAAIKPTILRSVQRVGERIQTGTGGRRRRRRKRQVRQNKPRKRRRSRRLLMGKRKAGNKQTGTRRKRVYKASRRARNQPFSSADFNF